MFVSFISLSLSRSIARSISKCIDTRVLRSTFHFRFLVARGKSAEKNQSALARIESKLQSLTEPIDHQPHRREEDEEEKSMFLLLLT